MTGDASSRRPAARAPPDGDVRTDVHGNGAGLTDNDDTDTDADVDSGAFDHTPDPDWTPPSDLSDVFKTLAGISSPHAWAESNSLGPGIKHILKSWSSPASGFRPPQKDTCLHPAFAKLTTECKAFVEHAFS